MKNILGIVLLFLVGGVGSGYISRASSNHLNKNISTDAPSASMVFPVTGKKSKIGSFWGAVRDGGRRKHEGIDIFAPKKTPVVAVTDGIVTSVGNGGRGGKTVWLRSLDNGFTYYYAHLDQQFVHFGQIVKKGQAIGSVGNTGNARLTPPHLHFGIYTAKGAVNPLPYVKGLPRITLPAVPADEQEVLTSQNNKSSSAASPIAAR